jgi:hypothetical protein
LKPNWLYFYYRACVFTSGNAYKNKGIGLTVVSFQLGLAREAEGAMR